MVPPLKTAAVAEFQRECCRGQTADHSTALAPGLEHTPPPSRPLPPAQNLLCWGQGCWLNMPVCLRRPRGQAAALPEVVLWETQRLPELLLALVATCTLRSFPSGSAPSREVPLKDAKEYAESIGAIVVETSAKNAINIEELFQGISKYLKLGPQPSLRPCRGQRTRLAAEPCGGTAALVSAAAAVRVTPTAGHLSPLLSPQFRFRDPVLSPVHLCFVN